MLTEGHTWDQYWVIADLDHFVDWVFQSVRHKLCLYPLEHSLQDHYVPKGIVGFGINLQSQIVPEILAVVFGDDTRTVEVTGQLDCADNPGGRDSRHVQHLHVKLGVVGNEDVVFIIYQRFELLIDLTSHEGWYILDHFVGYMVDGHGIYEDIVLLHGFASSTYTWEGLAPRLQAEGHHVWTLDMKGFGWSDKPRDGRYDPVTLMEGVNKWMAAMDLSNVILVGNSLGGAVTVLLALEHPERIKKMVLIDSAGYPMRLPLIIRMAHLPLSGSFIKLFFGRWMVRWNLKEVFYHEDRVTEEKVSAYYDRMCAENALDAQTSVARA